MKKPTTSPLLVAGRILLSAVVVIMLTLMVGPSWTDALAQTASPQPTAPSESPARVVESCKTSMAIVRSPEPPLNVYSAPSTEKGKVVGQLQSGTMVFIAAEQNGWFQISQPISGWIIKQRTESGCNEMVEQVRTEAPTSSPFITQQGRGTGANQVIEQSRTGTRTSTTLISDRFIGTGSHTYQFQAEKGQVMTITRQAGMFPMVQAPDGTFLMDRRDEQRSTWSQELTQTGTYSVQLDSNYKGYSYRFQVEIR